MAADASSAVQLMPAVALLVAAIVVVPIFKRFKLDAVLGYLTAGLIIGPFGFGIFTDPDAIIHFAELGVVMFLFIIGLEMQTSRLWGLRKEIFGLGVLQVALAGLTLTLAGISFGYGTIPAFIFGIGFTMTSTAIVFQMLNERRQMASAKGQRIVSVLLLEDLAIVPILALLGFMAAGSSEVTLENRLVSILVAAGAVLGLILIGRYLLNPVFERIARVGLRELMTGASLLVVLGSAYLKEQGGLSMAMGAFLAGVLLSESKFRHQLEADIEPFRGLLLGLFFMGVGMALNLTVIQQSWHHILALLIAFMVLKGLVIYVVGRTLRSSHKEVTERSAVMMQGGEFAFVIFATAATFGLIGAEESAIFATTVILSMIMTPFILMAHDRLIKPAKETTDDLLEAENLSASVLLIGFGRVGQLVSQPLLLRGFDVTIVDKNPDSIRDAAKFGFRVYYGDGCRSDVLHAAGAHHAAAIIICVDNHDEQIQITEMLRHELPNTPILVRANNRLTAIRLQQVGATFQQRETLLSALRLGQEALVELGVPFDQVLDTMADVEQRDLERLAAQMSGDVNSGQDLLVGNAPKPTPLAAPLHQAKAANEETAAILQQSK
ncbi:MAG: monovalent cation:proton antiporter-2 (CPA2) family protein [Moraxellaceae bacterium]|nr:monovalent cation:proton antiporter-2 (CPA2) family protein [Moraxellaceae bacterium]